MGDVLFIGFDMAKDGSDTSVLTVAKRLNSGNDTYAISVINTITGDRAVELHKELTGEIQNKDI